MKITIGRLRGIIRQAILESGGGYSKPPQPFTGTSLSSDINNREALGRLEFGEPEEQIADHLMEPDLTPEDCWGPVPPQKKDPGVYQDPFSRDFSPLPKPPIQR